MGWLLAWQQQQEVAAESLKISGALSCLGDVSGAFGSSRPPLPHRKTGTVRLPDGAAPPAGRTAQRLLRQKEGWMHGPPAQAPSAQMWVSPFPVCKQPASQPPLQKLRAPPDF